MKKTKRFLAVVATMAMALAPTCTYAAPATTTGSAAAGGLVEGAIVKDYVDYVAPTMASDAFDFVLDPQGLIAATDGKSIKGNTANAVVTDDATSVYFQNDDHYATSSDALTVTNMGSGEISVSVKATLGLDATGASINVVTNSAAVATGSALNLRIHLDQVSGGSATASLAKDATVATKSALTVDVTAAGADEDQFEVTKSAANGYEYKPKADATSGGAVSFVFRGECNTQEAADWTKVKDMTATFDVVWDIKASSGTTEVYALPWGSNFFAGTDNNKTNTAGFPAGTTLADFSEVTLINVTKGGDPYDALALKLASVDSTTVPGKTYLKIAGGTKDGSTWTLNFTYKGTSYTSTLVY